jgi:hypothetical protein
MSPSRTALDELAERNADAAVDADRVRRNDFLRSGAACLAWAGMGLYGIAWSAHTTDATLGSAAFFAGLGVGNGGIIFTLLSAYRRGEVRGDW